jgi:hypothetical protein
MEALLLLRKNCCGLPRQQHLSAGGKNKFLLLLDLYFYCFLSFFLHSLFPPVNGLFLPGFVVFLVVNIRKSEC